jgi:uncharacterized protein (TIGR02118 family)
MPVAAFREHWRDNHAPLITRLPGIRGYVQNYPLPGTQPLFDAVAESSFDDMQAMKALARSPQYAAVLADEPNFIDRPSMGTILTEAHVLRDGAPGPGAVKEIRFVRRDPQVDVDSFFERFLAEGPRAAALPGTLRYEQWHARRSIYDSGRTPAYDGFAIRWLAPGSAISPDRFSLIVTERVVL